MNESLDTDQFLENRFFGNCLDFPNQSDYIHGYSGKSLVESGYFYCPYVELTMTPTVMLSDLYD